MSNFFKYALYFLIVLVIGGAIATYVVYKELPWWIGVSIVLGVLALYLGLVAIKKYLSRRHERDFVQSVISQENGNVDFTDNKLHLAKQSIASHFLEGIAKLKSSRLKKEGNALYSLPWFLFFGENNSGKSELLTSSNLTSALTDVQTSRATQSCDWWYFDNSVILDISGKYLENTDNILISKEWQYLLELISKYRRKEPLNGLVVTISAESLYSDSESKLINDGRLVRQRINQLMRVVGASFPVYVMVTKIDLMFGVNDLLKTLPPEIANESFGFTNDDLSSEFINNFEDNLKKILDGIENDFAQVIIKAIADNGDTLVGINQAGKELHSLNKKLETYIGAIFKKNPYQNMLMFRGIYYSSVAQDGKVLSDFNEKFLFENPSSGSKKSFFINKFIKSILPSDRYLFDYLDEFLSWKRALKSLWMGMLIVIILTTTVFAIFSYNQNYNVLEQAQKFNMPRVTKNLAFSVKENYDVFLTLLDIQKHLNEIIFADIGFKEAEKAYSIIQNDFVKKFEENILHRLDAKIAQLVKNNKKTTGSAEGDMLIDYYLHSVDINNRLEKDGSVTLNEEDKDSIVNILGRVDVNNVDLAYRFISMYEQYLNWSAHTKDFEKRSFVIKEHLDSILSSQDINFHWLINNNLMDGDAITLAGFWPGLTSEFLSRSHKIPGAFTEKGRQKIKNNIKIIEETLSEHSPRVKYFLNEFWSWYDLMYIKTWKDFIQNFSEPIKNYDYKESQPMLLLGVSSAENPYTSALQVSAEEIGKFNKEKQTNWMKELIQMNQYLQISKKISAQENQSKVVTAKIHEEAEKIKNKLDGMLDEKYANMIDGAINLDNYLKSLDKLSAIDSDIDSNVKQFFSDNRKDSLLEQTYQLLTKFKYSVKDDIKDDLPFEFINGAFYFILEYAINRESCHINEVWRKNVLFPSQSLGELDLVSKLFDTKEGLAAKFLENDINHFMNVDADAYIPNIIHGKYAVPFSKEFLTYIKHGSNLMSSIKKSYDVTFSFKPIGSNYDILKRPFSFTLNVDCQKENLKIGNFNFEETKTLKWEPSECGDASIAIGFEGFDLVKTYPGKLGFSKFLKDFSDSHEVFTPADFPDSTALMKENNIKKITIRFDIAGDLDAVNLLDPIPYKVPKTISSCK